MQRTSYYQRNQVKLQAYQREYARQRRAPGRRKFSKAERETLEEQCMHKFRLMAMESLPPCSNTIVAQTYKFPPVVDLQRTPDMMAEEEKAMEYFEERKDILQLFSPSVWKDEFQKCVEEFIERHLLAAEVITATSVTAEDYSQLHGLRRLIAGAIQEAELVRQPAYAATCAKLDKALVWDGRSVDLGKFRRRYGW